MNKKLVIYGTGQTADIIYDYFLNDSDYEIISFVDEKKFIKSKYKFGLPVVSANNILKNFDIKNTFFFIAISYHKLNYIRQIKYEYLKSLGLKFANYVNSKLVLHKSIKIGKNCFISDNVSLQPFSKIGNNVFVWSNTVVGHHTIIRDHCWLTSNSTIGGNTKIGKCSFLGINSMIGHMISIGSNNFIGSGSIINESTKNNSVYIEKKTSKYFLDAESFMEITNFK